MAQTKGKGVETEWHEFLVSARNFQELTPEELVKFLKMGDLHDDWRAVLMGQLKTRKGL